MFKNPQNTQVLFLDMNAFFASVEQQVQPTLRGKPVGIAPYIGDSGCIISQSYEAKSFGVKTGLRVGEAKKACPQMKIIEARPALYSLYHKELVNLVHTFSPFVSVASIDEMYVKLTPLEQNSLAAEKLAIEIKKAIKVRVGDWLRCSIGIGPNSFLAKQAAEFKKPDGYFEIKLENLNDYYDAVNLTDLKGINYQMEKWCHRINIYSPLQFYQADLGYLRKHWGHPGANWYFKLHGHEITEAKNSTKTIGHSCVLPPEMRTIKSARLVMAKLVEKTAYRLRKEGYWAQGVHVSVYFLNRVYWAQSMVCPLFSDNQTFLEHAMRLIDRCKISGSPIRISVTLYKIVYTKDVQYSLFGNTEKKLNISRAIDHLNDKYGAQTVSIADSFGSRDYAPDRIPFGKPRYDIRH